MESLNPTQVVFIKPTSVFYAFLLSQLGEEKLPDYKLLTVDTTAFLIPYFQEEEKTIEFIASIYPNIFKYEIQRWLGKEVKNAIFERYDDFVSCFRLSYHSYVFSTTPLTSKNAFVALSVHPQKALLTAIKKDSKLMTASQLQLPHIEENGSVFLLPLNEDEELICFLHEQFESIASLEKKRLGLLDAPIINTYHEFIEYFSVHIHSHVLRTESLFERVY